MVYFPKPRKGILQRRSDLHPPPGANFDVTCSERLRHLRPYFCTWRDLVFSRRQDEYKARYFHSLRISQRCFAAWRAVAREAMEARADRHFRQTTLRKCLRAWAQLASSQNARSERELYNLRRQRSQSLAQMKDFASSVSELKKQLGIDGDEDGDERSAGSPMPFSRQWRRRSTDAAIRVR